MEILKMGGNNNVLGKNDFIPVNFSVTDDRQKVLNEMKAQ